MLAATHRGLLARTAALVGFAGALTGRPDAGRVWPGASPAECYVPAPGANAVVVYRPVSRTTTADDDLRPVRTIAGPHTGLREPAAVAVDARGALFVLNAGERTITVYAPGATGDVAPVRSVAVPTPGLTATRDIDRSRPALRVMHRDTASSILVYAPGAQGDVRPVRTIAGPHTGLGLAVGAAVARTGELYVLRTSR